MAVNSVEYATLIRHTNDVCLAVKADLLGVGGDLLSKHLITKVNEDELRNAMISEDVRAARLVGFMQDKVEEDPQHYHTFIEVLRERGESRYGGILRKLQETYNNPGM